jgi:hypothetical protein
MEFIRGQVRIWRGGKIFAILIGLAIGAMIWGVSPIFVGAIEPWDSEGFFYPAALFLSGVVVWAIFRSTFPLAIAGIYFGQLGYLLAIGRGPLVIVGFLLLVPYSFIAAAGSLLASAIAARGSPKGRNN